MKLTAKEILAELLRSTFNLQYGTNSSPQLDKPGCEFLRKAHRQLHLAQCAIGHWSDLDFEVCIDQIEGIPTEGGELEFEQSHYDSDIIRARRGNWTWYVEATTEGGYGDDGTGTHTTYEMLCKHYTPNNTSVSQ